MERPRHVQGRCMSFDLEADMVAPVQSWLRSQGLTVKREFATPWGICDLVACSLDPDRVRQRMELRQRESIGSQFRVSVLLMIPDERTRRSVTLRQLQRLAGPYASRAQLLREVDRLIERRFVDVTKRGTFRRRNGWMPLHRQLLAVELKLRRVEDALTQARANLGFSDQSFVAFPRDVATRIAHTSRAEAFARIGVGVLAVARRRVDMLVPAPRCKPEYWAACVHAVERFWQTRARDS